MVEKVYTLVVLLQTNIITAEEYNASLDELFLENLDNKLLLELQCFSKNINDTRSIITEYIYQNNYVLDYNVFGRALFKNLSELYKSNVRHVHRFRLRRNRMSIEKFARKMHRVWNFLPGEIQSVEPFWALSYAYNLLYCGEKQTRQLYERAFSYDWNTEIARPIE